MRGHAAAVGDATTGIPHAYTTQNTGAKLPLELPMEFLISRLEVTCTISYDGRPLLPLK